MRTPLRHTLRLTTLIAATTLYAAAAAAQPTSDKAKATSAATDTSLAALQPKSPAHLAALTKLHTTADSVAKLVPGGRAHVQGNPLALVTVEEFVDMQCPACAASATYTAPALRPFIAAGKVRVITYHLPLPFHEQALDGAMFAECAADQRPDGFYAAHDALLTRQAEWANPTALRAGLEKIAGDLKMNAKQVMACYDAGPYANVLSHGIKEAIRRHVSATPTYFVNNVEYRGAISPAQVNQLLRQAITGDAPAAPVGPLWKKQMNDTIKKS